MESLDNGQVESPFHTLNVKKMLYIDDFMFVLGASVTNLEDEKLVQLKGVEVRNSFKIHNNWCEVLKYARSR